MCLLSGWHLLHTCTDQKILLKCSVILKSHARADKIHMYFVGFSVLATRVGLQNLIYGYLKYIFVQWHKFGSFFILNF